MLTSACAIPSRCFIPPEKPPTRVQRRDIEPEQSSGEHEVLARGHPRVEARNVGEEADPLPNCTARERDIMATDMGER